MTRTIPESVAQYIADHFACEPEALMLPETIHPIRTDVAVRLGDSLDCMAVRFNPNDTLSLAYVAATEGGDPFIMTEEFHCPEGAALERYEFGPVDDYFGHIEIDDLRGCEAYLEEEFQKKYEPDEAEELGYT